jgi:hypothetical protein
MPRCTDSDLPQDKALGTFARNRHSCHRSTYVDRGWSMTLNFMPLVILMRRFLSGGLTINKQNKPLLQMAT